MSNSPSASTADPFPAGEPAVIGRLPAGVEYTLVKNIVLGLPGPIDALPWFASAEDDPVGWSRFRGKTFRALDRVLCREEQRLLATAPQERGREHELTLMLRQQFVRHFWRALQQWHSEGTRRWVSARLVHPSWSASRARVPGLEHRGLVIEVWEAAKRGPRLLDRVVMPPGPPPWGDIRVQYCDPWMADRLCAAVFRRHFPELMRRRIGQGWWAERAPTAWPMITQYAIPRLYDYLRPYYRVRAYRKFRRHQTPGHYPLQLLKDITEILQTEVPHLADELTEAQVQAVVQRYLQKAPRSRPMGFDMFGIRLGTRTA